MHTTLGTLLEHMEKTNKVLSLRWIDSASMVLEGVDGLSRQHFDTGIYPNASKLIL